MPTVPGTARVSRAAPLAHVDVAAAPAVRWLARRWPPLALSLIATAVAVVTTAGTLAWVGRPFPGFLVMHNALVPSVGLWDWTGLRAGVPFHARVVAVDDTPVAGNGAVYDAVGRRPIGTPLRYTFEKAGTRFARVVPSMRFGLRDYALTFGLFVANGVFGIVAATVVALLRPRNPAARAFLFSFGFFWALFPLTGIALYDPALAWLAPLHYLAQATFPASFVHFALTFPVERPLVRRRSALAVPYLVSALLTVSTWAGMWASPPLLGPLYASYLYSSVSIATMVGLFAFAYWENRTPLVRPRLAVVLPGFAFAAAAAFYGFIDTMRSGGDFPTNLIALTPIVFFAAIAYAIAKHDAFDIDAVLRQTAIYFGLTIAVTVLYGLALVLLGAVLPPGSPLVTVGFVAAVATCFQPLRASVQHLVDRTFYRDRVDYRRLVSAVSEALTALLDLGEILARVGSAMHRGFHVRTCAVVLWLDDGTRLWRYDEVSGGMRPTPAGPFERVRERLTALHGPWCVAVDGADPDDEPPAPEPALAAELAAIEAVLLVPIRGNTGVLGAFALGHRRSGVAFGREDRELLGTLAAQAAIAIQNALSYQSLRALNETLEARVRERTADLQAAYAELQAAQAKLLHSEKMASLGQLVAGVAHEINNPVSFIAGSIAPLRERLAETAVAVAGPQHEALREAAELVEIMQRGAERTMAVVRDLRTFSRVDAGARKAVDLNEALDVTIRLLAPRWRGRIAIRREFGPLPLVECEAGPMNQVFMNLLANACDAIDRDGTVDVRTRAAGDRVVVEVRDDGCGMPPDVVRRVFEPFFTTKGVGRGMGLGLAISHGVVVAHGGTIDVDSAPGAGTTVRVVLPVAGASVDSALQGGR